MQRVRIGLVGAGLIGEIHSAVLQQMAQVLGGGRVQLAAVADPDPARRERFTGQFGYATAHADAATLLREAEIDAVFLCTPTRYHADLLRRSVERGLHVFCEKPLAMSYHEARGMVESAERAGVRAQTGLVLRFSPVYTLMRELLAAQEMGRPMAVLFRDDQCFPIRGLHATAWRKDRTLSAGGTLVEHGVHDVDVLTTLFGPIAWVRAWQRNLAGHAGIEDYIAAEVEFESGLHAQLVNVWHNVLQRHSNRRLEVFCENAFLASEDDMLGSIQRQVGDGQVETVPADVVLSRFLEKIGRAGDPMAQWLGIPYVLQDLSFVEALLLERSPAPDLRAGLEAQRIVEAIYHAARTDEAVEVRSFSPEPSAG